MAFLPDTVSLQCFFSLRCVLFPFTAVSIVFFTCLAREAWQSKMTTLWCQPLMPAPLKACQNFVMKHSDLPTEKHWVWALWMTLPESLSDGWVRGPDLNSTAGIIWWLSHQTLSAVLCLKICWLSHIGSLIPISWHCALFYNLLPR